MNQIRKRLHLLLLKLRFTRWATAIFGAYFKTNGNSIELDITYACHFGCVNCNRSSTQAKSDLYMPLEVIRDFITQSVDTDRKWKEIRVMGGEPMLHPQIGEIFDLLVEYKRAHLPGVIIFLKTNMKAKKVDDLVNRYAGDVQCVYGNSLERSKSEFVEFNNAPCDDPHFRQVDYRNGCSVTEVDGIGLSPLGKYYQCGPAGGIDRIFHHDVGKDSLPAADYSFDRQKESLCRYCGHFRFALSLDSNVGAKQITTDSWKKGYELALQERADKKKKAVGT